MPTVSPSFEPHNATSTAVLGGFLPCSTPTLANLYICMSGGGAGENEEQSDGRDVIVNVGKSLVTDLTTRDFEAQCKIDTTATIHTVLTSLYTHTPTGTS